ncbi:hypothetical protein ACFOY2_09100 [Nonomuraea purpurea]|uniref:Secreted protein n=1 Tax=Nonomuraea purpurea TaxID=1849276 RepID=A0ABV8G100_9ACTN
MRKKLSALAGAPALALALVACGATGLPSGGGGESETGAQAEASTADVPQETPTTAPPAAPQQPTETAQTSAQQLSPGPVASQQFDVRGSTMTVAITKLQRSGKVTTLNFTITHEKGASWRINNDMGESPVDNTVGGISLIDAGNAKRYRPGRTGNNRCLCSAVSGGLAIEPGKSYSLYATFAAPPPDVTKVNIELPVFGILSDVPIS